MIHIGFTGTQKGMTEAQYDAVLSLLLNYTEFCAHHGDCIGADAQFHSLARTMGGWRWMYVYPCDIEDKRAHCYTTDIDRVFDPKPPLVRNRDIVDASDIVIATPETIEEKRRRSGTWSTIRYARDRKKKLFIIAPNGAVFTENA